MSAEKRFAVLLCAEDSEYVKKVYGGYLRVFMALLEEEGEAWDVYRVAKGEFPAEDMIRVYDGFVVTGSCSDADSDEAWIRNLVALLRRLHESRKKVLGICFGHQVLSRALGGKTVRAINGWDIGVTCIHPSPSLRKLLVPPHLPVIQCHQDEVSELPPFVEVLARSEKTGIEMFRCGNHIMGIQGHPEYTKGILLHLVDRLLQHNLIQNCHAEVVKASLDAREPDREAWERLCKGFLKGRLDTEFKEDSRGGAFFNRGPRKSSSISSATSPDCIILLEERLVDSAV